MIGSSVFSTRLRMLVWISVPPGPLPFSQAGGA
jgi:hypothetical protein